MIFVSKENLHPKLLYTINVQKKSVTKEKERSWKLENWEALPQQDYDEQNDFSETEEST